MTNKEKINAVASYIFSFLMDVAFYDMIIFTICAIKAYISELLGCKFVSSLEWLGLGFFGTIAAVMVALIKRQIKR